MDESYSLAKFKWENGVYDLPYMIWLVEKKGITEREFHQITGYNYAAAAKEILETRSKT